MNASLAAHEKRLKTLDGEIAATEQAAQAALAQAEQVVAAFREKGVNPLTNDVAADRVTHLYAGVDVHTDKLAELRKEQAGVLSALSALIPHGGEGSTYGYDGNTGMRLEFGPDDMRGAFDAIRKRQPVALGGAPPMAAIDGTSFPQGAVAEYRIGDVFPFLREVPIIADLFPMEGTDRDSVVVYKTTSPASAAAAVSAGATKPTSSPGWSPVTVQMQVIAHIATVDNRIVADYDSWLGVIGAEMFGGLLSVVDSEILSGSAVSPHLHGILTDGGIGQVDWDPTNEKRSEALHRGMTAVRLAVFANATDIVLHPSDLEAIRFEKASGTGNFINGEPLDGDINNLWGLRVSPTTAISQGTALVLNPRIAGRLIVRQSPVLEINPWSETEWKKNELSLRNEARLGFALVNAGAVCKVNLT